MEMWEIKYIGCQERASPGITGFNARLDFVPEENELAQNRCTLDLIWPDPSLKSFEYQDFFLHFTP